VVRQVWRMCGTVCEDVVGGMRMCSVVQVITNCSGLLRLQCSSTCAQGDAAGAAAGCRRSYEHRQVRGTITYERMNACEDVQNKQITRT